MATSMVSIPRDTWTLVSEVSVNFQVVGQSSVYIIESVSAPAAGDLTIRKIANPRRLLNFTKIDGDFYAYSEGSINKIAIDPVV